MKQTCRDHQHEWEKNDECVNYSHFQCVWCIAEMWERMPNPNDVQGCWTSSDGKYNCISLGIPKDKPKKLQEIEELCWSYLEHDSRTSLAEIEGKLNQVIRAVNQLVKERE